MPEELKEDTISLSEFFSAWNVVHMNPLLVSVNSDDWGLALIGNKDASKRIKKALDGVILYEHAFPKEKDEVVISLTALFRVIPSLTLKIGFE